MHAFYQAKTLGIGQTRSLQLMPTNFQTSYHWTKFSDLQASLFPKLLPGAYLEVPNITFVRNHNKSEEFLIQEMSPDDLPFPALDFLSSNLTLKMINGWSIDFLKGDGNLQQISGMKSHCKLRFQYLRYANVQLWCVALKNRTMPPDGFAWEQKWLPFVRDVGYLTVSEEECKFWYSHYSRTAGRAIPWYLLSVLGHQGQKWGVCITVRPDGYFICITGSHGPP